MIFLLISSRVLPNNHCIRRAGQSSEGLGGQHNAARQSEKTEEKEEEVRKKEAEEKAKEKAVERTQAIRSSLSKLRSKFDQIRK